MGTTPPARSGRERVVLSAEQLEDRTVPSGNVTAVVVDGMLRIDGDARANQILVTGLDDGAAIITPVGDTTVNGGSAAVTLGGIVFAYDIRLGGGDDFLWVSGTQGDIGLFVNMGDGNNALEVDYAAHTGPTVLLAGAGNDTIGLGMGEYDGITIISAGGGDNQVIAGGTTFGAVLFAAGSGANTLSIPGVNFRVTPLTIGFQTVISTLPPPGGIPPPTPSPPTPTAGPVPTISTTATNPTNLASIPFTVTFNRNVTGFNATDVSVTNGTVSGFGTTTPRTYTFQVTPTADGVVQVSLAAGAAQDAAGRGSRAATASITSDRTAPTVAIRAGSSPSSDPNAIPFTVTFNENVTGFTAAEVVVTGGTASGFTPVNGRTYTLTVAPTAGSTLVRVNVAAGVATDAAGNANTAAPEFTTIPTRTDAGMVAATNPPDPDAPNWQERPDGLKVWDVQVGTGPVVTAGSTIGVFYTGWLLDGTVFDSARTAGSPVSFALSGLIEGWQEGIPGMQPGGIRRLYIPAELAYGSVGTPTIPPNSDLIFEIKLISVV